MSANTTFSLSEQETYELGMRLAGTLKGGELVVLEGDLGLGKTVFARGIAASLGVVPEDVTSPSFTLVQEYSGGRLPMFHVDLYRLNDEPQEIESLGLDDLLDSGGVVVVEWGEKLPAHVREHAIAIRFHDMGEGSRKIEIDAGARNSAMASDA
ncbi:MAG: tRNA (adenosine(37)-N6)-threonylcarbamoyltransferase complex ATPase subunit type 1 TsaE [Acidobacteria bacterium]|uniref:tRNA threonylcarbamoyladenosine biosynthesis protein TsaE n=1 Tax=Candidatus Polarisedimenticola svalbardensis TaxID=2886004 RepID=A0A8J6Y6Q5_9BACT|nr:tRNA (adenosine(37)-N6)-threonylcarbamoyltransferase complex ATPase subunit type 1 TsaE [Candidatus Polarisedimenticola svalbardensis]